MEIKQSFRYELKPNNHQKGLLLKCCGPFEFDATLYECYDKNGKMLGYVPTKYEEKDISFNIKNLSLDDIERA